MPRIALIALLLLTLTACVPSPAAVPTATPTIAPTIAPTLTTEPTPQPALANLPAAIYFIDGETRQIVRLERDGRTRTQMTDEPQPLLDLDAAGATLVYITGDLQGERTLKIIDASGQRDLLYGEVSSPRISPDGQTIIYRLDNPEPGLIIGQDESPAGVWSSAPEGMRPGLVRVDEPGDGVYDPDSPAWRYTPVAWSPDGRRLALYAFDEDGPGIPGGELLLLDWAGGGEIRAPSCCEAEQWSADSRSLTVAGGGPGPDIRYGLYKIDAITGIETPIIESDPDSPVPFVTWPVELADGQVYALVERVPAEQAGWDYAFRPALARVAPDGAVTPLAPPIPSPAEALWDYGGAGVLVVIEPDARPDSSLSGQILWLPLDSGSAVALHAKGSRMDWAP